MLCGLPLITCLGPVEGIFLFDFKLAGGSTLTLCEGFSGSLCNFMLNGLVSFESTGFEGFEDATLVR